MYVELWNDKGYFLVKKNLLKANNKAFWFTMFILASDFSKNAINTFLKLEIRVVCREFVAFKYTYI